MKAYDRNREANDREMHVHDTDRTSVGGVGAGDYDQRHLDPNKERSYGRFLRQGEVVWTLLTFLSLAYYDRNGLVTIVMAWLRSWCARLPSLVCIYDGSMILVLRS